MRSSCGGPEYRYVHDMYMDIDGIGTLVSKENMPDTVSRWKSLVERKSKKYDVPTAVVMAVLWGESRGNPNAGSYAGAQGLMQIMPGTARYLVGRSVSNSEMMDPDFNMDMGAKLLASLYKKHDGNLPHVFASYNAGSARCGTGRRYPSGDPCSPPNIFGLVENCGYIMKCLKYYNKCVSMGISGRVPSAIKSVSKKGMYAGLLIGLFGTAFVYYGLNRHANG